VKDRGISPVTCSAGDPKTSKHGRMYRIAYFAQLPCEVPNRKGTAQVRARLLVEAQQLR
jgi:hypothetical protein